MLDSRIATLTTTTRTPAAPRWELGDAVLLRSAGTSAHATVDLRFPRLRAWSADLLRAEADRDALAESLRDTLTALVAQFAADDPARAAVINLRRDVFNARAPKEATRRAIAGALPSDIAAHVEQWLGIVDSHNDRLAAGATILATELPEVREHARRHAGTDDLRCAVLLQSEILERNMDRYLTAAKLDKHARQVERTLLEMVYRATMKTSPFSTLTSVSMCRLSAAPAAALPGLAATDKHHVARLNVAFLARLAGAIAHRPDLRADFVVALAPGTRLDEDLVRYARRRTSQNPDEGAVVSMDSVHESLFFLPSGPALADVANVVSSGTVTVADAAMLVRFASGDSRSVADVDALLGHLLRLGLLLLPQLQIDLHAADPSAGFVATLARQTNPVLRTLAGHLAAAVDLTARYADTPARARAAVLQQIRDELHAAADLVGAPGIVPRTILYEDTFRPVASPAVAATGWRERLLPDLARLARILPAFDVNLPRRLTARGFFTARYGVGGRCVDLEQFCHEFQRDFYDPYSKRIMRRQAFSADNEFQPQENWFKLPQITALDNARTAASRTLGGVAARTPASAEVQLDDGILDAITSALGDDPAFAIPWSFFAQLTGDPADPGTRLVVNQAYAGMTLMFSRFAHGLQSTDPDTIGTLASVLRRAAPPGAVLAELRGGYDTTNLNIHPAVTDVELVCPGDIGSRPPSQQIHLHELEIRHDTETGDLLLWCPRLAARVIPVYLGFLMPMALPEIQQVLLCFSPSGMAQLDLWAGTGIPVPEDTISEYPRLALGDIVLQRRMWKIPVGCFPQRPPAGEDAAYYAQVQRWRVANGIPDRVFAQVDFAAAAAQGTDDGDEGTDEKGRPKASRKPLAVDFDSWFSVALLEQLVAGAQSRLVVTEALPSLDQLWLRDPDGKPYVSELLVEIYPKESADE